METVSKDLMQTDALIPRDRQSRLAVAIASLAGSVAVPTILGAHLIDWSLGLPQVGFVGGLIGGLFATRWMWHRVAITNDVKTAFMTIDPTQTLFERVAPDGDTEESIHKKFPTYAAGLKLCFPWEIREVGNVVGLGEVPVQFVLEVQCEDGNIFVGFSARIRVDVRRIPRFLQSAGNMTSELKDLISAEIIEYLSERKVTEALKQVRALNVMLEKFSKKTEKADQSEFESRFGVIVNDVTVGSMLLSDQVKETLGAKTEMNLINEMVASSYGYATIAEVEEAIKAKRLDREDVNRRRTQAMAMSGNLQGMDLKESTTNFRFMGLDQIDPALIKAFAELAPILAELLRRTGKPEATASSNQPRNPRRGAKGK